MKKALLKSWLMRITVFLELVLAIFIATAIIIGMVDLVRYIVLIFTTNPIDTYDLFQKFLGHVLLLVVGVELVAMLVTHTPGSVIEVLLYAVARHMLIGSKGTFDFIMGIASIAGIFAIKKYLFVDNICGDNDRSVFSAVAGIAEGNDAAGVTIPESMAGTIGGVVSHIARESRRQVYEGAVFCVSDAEIKVLKVNSGVIEQVAVAEQKD